jgi:hypothetical protein
MKTYRTLNTEAGELPVVGDEVFCQGKDPGQKWYSIPQDELDYFQGTAGFGDRIFRRELHPQEMAKDIAGKVIKEYVPSTLYLKDGDRLKSRLITDRELSEFLLPHIQAALEGKG